MRTRAFTLVEVILVVAILGILSALVLPTFQGHAAEARVSAARDTLRTMRSQIELYKMQHDGIPPGYANGNPISAAMLAFQFTATTKENGAVSPSTVPAGEYRYGPYMRKLPENPYNNLSTIAYVAEAAAFAANDSTGWLYKKETGEFKINKTGVDSKGVAFIDY
ncbi:MAG: prepilin-type N-terminal cleavage/methylation domain-containing protein [Sedimentisphaerales bacterium]|nr:prepilin-type N-terminal cleavage/methylation domain-containing protein [Sedimentisphaerales bacterium]